MDAKTTTLIRAYLNRDILRGMKYLAVDTGVPVQGLLVEGALLLLRCHQRADGLPPCPPGDQDGTTEQPAKKGGN
jgi:hypothetical protein